MQCTTGLIILKPMNDWHEIARPQVSVHRKCHFSWPFLFYLSQLSVMLIDNWSGLKLPTCWQYSRAMRFAHSTQRLAGRAGFDTSAHLIIIRLMRVRFSGSDSRVFIDIWRSPPPSEPVPLNACKQTDSLVTTYIAYLQPLIIKLLTSVLILTQDVILKF